MDRGQLLQQRKRKRGVSGYVTVEYAIVTGFLIAALILPVPGTEHSIIDVVINAIRNFQLHSTSMLALP